MTLPAGQYTELVFRGRSRVVVQQGMSVNRGAAAGCSRWVAALSNTRCCRCHQFLTCQCVANASVSAFVTLWDLVSACFFHCHYSEQHGYGTASA